jgi:hypothetical protein
MHGEGDVGLLTGHLISRSLVATAGPLSLNSAPARHPAPRPRRRCAAPRLRAPPRLQTIVKTTGLNWAPPGALIDGVFSKVRCSLIACLIVVLDDV